MAKPPKPTWLNAAKVGAIVFIMVGLMNAIMTYLLTGAIQWGIVILSSTVLGTFLAILWKWKIGQLSLLKQAVGKGK